MCRPGKGRHGQITRAIALALPSSRKRAHGCRQRWRSRRSPRSPGEVCVPHLRVLCVQACSRLPAYVQESRDHSVAAGMGVVNGKKVNVRALRPSEIALKAIVEKGLAAR